METQPPWSTLFVGPHRTTVPVRVSADETLDIGADTGTPIIRDYQVPFRFTGEIEKLDIDLKPTEAASAPGRPD